MNRLKNKGKSIATVIIMFAGILIGLIVIFNKTQDNSKPTTFHEFVAKSPGISMHKYSHSIKEFAIVFKAKRRIYELMKKDRLSKQDSIEIKAIDQQLNQLLHD